jgi:hypothetical protein
MLARQLRDTPRPRPIAGTLVVAALAALAGCVTVDSTVKADGSGTLTMKYAPPKDATDASEKARFTSDAVTLESLDLAKDHKSGTVKVKFSDVTKLSTAKGFKDVTATLTKADGTESLAIKIANPGKLPPEKVADVKKLSLPPMKIAIALPGKALEAGQHGTTKDATVTWTIPIADFAAQDSIDLSVKYELPKG